uniref:NADH dehydrogenase subunit 6 n=1 Tax=Armadillidium vulgare TaxID=13347 RepID=A0A221SE51_ARMVU|nr:NADH dehydrogenase subunit 6 [Armadillidium vulgare]
MCVMVSCLIISIESPQLFVMYLLFQSGLMVIFMGLLGGVWYAYILFLVFLGGMLILFVYTSSLAAEVKLDYSVNKYFMVLFSGLFMVLLISMSSMGEYLGESDNFNIEGDMMKELVSMFSGALYLYVVIYLLIALYNVCWMMKIFEGPLQKFTLSNS